MTGSRWGTTPRQSIEAACERLGIVAVLRDCVTLLGGGDPEPAIVEALGGPGAARFLDAPADQRYWLRVWGARGLLWALTAPSTGGAPAEPASTVGPVSPAEPAWVVAALVDALADEHWRVREMALKAVARYRLDDAQPQVAALLTDDTPRVRAAAARALRLLTVPDR